MKIWLKIDPKTEKVKDFKWQTWGCATAIASTSAFSEMVIDMTIEDALKIKPQDIMKRLGGLPDRKIQYFAYAFIRHMLIDIIFKIFNINVV